ncbi:formate dehydrogenase subunit gamma [Yoonia sediminilitoris]|uniref:Formate dehydrogenase gamma subunit n=1 Tax=Yoonia sediminilitoris TaxID=1286148 RepID=A0A2T6KAG5_9RHOB|nr:formate dehydrogenase subunit gamma [Yoonia sediminilitoris]PUB11813.1 formate dehydrogenase gamma subunit [Yoonia sediminilitoris]RCW91890.1 formate dehydrogenase gamma subunit [Yoonia sediminilitoris]
MAASRTQALQGCATWSRLTMHVICLLAMLFVMGITHQLQAQGTAPPYPFDAGPENTLGNQSDSDIWRMIRQGADGLPSSSEVVDGVLINANGVGWSELRRAEGPLIWYGGLGLAAVIAAVVLFFVIRGRLRIDGGRSGKTVARFSLVQRVVHWIIACLFLLLGVTGLLLLFGRPLLIPIIGKSAYSVFATASMQAHNLFGPIFIVSFIALFFSFVRGNLPSLCDLQWITRAGGMFGGHASAGRYNAGEKAWFWTATLAGITLSASGILLSFPDALGTHDLLHWAELSHAIAAFVFIGFGIGHIYLGTIGTEGTIEGMVNGCVDENWARTHHDLWLADMKSREKGADG